jgi:hypothetical protein
MTKCLHELSQATHIYSVTAGLAEQRGDLNISFVKQEMPAPAFSTTTQKSLLQPERHSILRHICHQSQLTTKN